MDLEQIPSSDISWKQKKFPIAVLAENIHSPENIGMIMRVCEAFGVSLLIFTGKQSNTSSKKYRSTARSANYYLDIRSIESKSEALNILDSENYQLIALEICNSSEPLHKLRKSSEKIALIIGSERYGVSEFLLKRAAEKVHIEQYGKLGSINVVMALSIALYEFTKN